MPVSTEQLNRWLMAWKGWPKWAQIASASGLVCVLGLAMLLSAASGAGSGGTAVDPALNDPTRLALDVFVKLGVIVLLIFGAALVLRRWQAGGWKASPRQMKVVETVHLSPRRALHLVRIGDRELLIGATDQALTLLSEVEPAQSVQPEPTRAIPVSTFADVFSQTAQSLDAPVHS